ncbi:MAG: agmatine deiminase family protein [Bacteroidales bacterium]|jgi:agmatine deiminase|nr:agmatine deiminase family protein [Bacteroidales bacterium]
MNTPFEDGFYFPAEWMRHEATWLTYPYNESSFPGKLPSVYPAYLRFIAEIAAAEKVRINVPAGFREQLEEQLREEGISDSRTELFDCENDDVWCRDHGPAFVIHPRTAQKAIVDWEFNAWGGKYPCKKDNRIAGAIARRLSLPAYRPNIVMEGGSVEFNGEGSLLTTRSCLLNPNRNPHLSQGKIEQYLHQYYGVSQVLWLEEGIAGDDTDGHVDNLTRFIAPDTVATVVEHNKKSPNYRQLQHNLQLLKKMRLLNGRQLNIIELPMPDPVIYQQQRLPASYANFYFTNDALIVPVFRRRQDEKALQILETCIPHRRVTGIDSTDLIWGGGSFHCLSQQEPFAVPDVPPHSVKQAPR